MSRDADIIAAFRHYLGRARHVLGVIEAHDPGLLGQLPWPGTFPVGQHLLAAMNFALRGLTVPQGIAGPGWPAEVTPETLHAFAEAAEAALALVDRLPEPRVTHTAGFAELEQEAGEFLLSYALPNMIFHLTVAYGAARAAGVPLGKADFDGFHAYPPDFSF